MKTDKMMLADCLVAAFLSVAIQKSPTLSTTTLDSGGSRKIKKGGSKEKKVKQQGVWGAQLPRR